ncbi:Protein of unknown function [Amycolatopsis tolypomycina]|uniref:DUF3558 domain-containing protein n=1 Tax=Amycolatopsis tolypomycina TaxID=208445 RepID=A0A1H4V3K0_9PSEU|nr:Protein of unknown function [Amycolatopsis tolypomycina]
MTACTTTKDGTASPSSTGSTSASSSPGDPEVPKVSVPLDASKYAADPCGLVPADVLTPLRLPVPGEIRSAGNDPRTKGGPSCVWKIRGEGTGVSMTVLTNNRDRGAGGLAGLYAGYKQQTLIRFLEPAPDVDGYPAIYFDLTDMRSVGSCGLGVGIADDLAVDVYAQGYQGQDDSCGTAAKIAAAMIKTLKGA